MCRDDESCIGEGLAPTCIDLPGTRSGKEWFDGTNGCKLFEQADKDGLMFCSKFGSGDLGEGSAEDRCCTCGGGGAAKGPTRALFRTIQGGIMDFNVLHDGEAPGPGDKKYVVQAFTWLLPNGNYKDIVGP